MTDSRERDFHSRQRFERLPDFPAPIEWEYDATASWPWRALLYAPVAAVGGLVVLVLALISVVVAEALRVGDVELLILGGVVVLAFLTLRGRVFVALRQQDLPRPPPERRPFAGLDRRAMAAAALLGAFVLFVAVRAAPVLALAAFVAGVGIVAFVPLVRTRGVVDAADFRLTCGERTTSLVDLERVRSVAVGPLTYCWLSFERGTVGVWGPRFVVLSTNAYHDTRPVFDQAIDTPAEAEPISSSQRVVALVLGVALLAVGPALWFLVPPNTGASDIVVYAGLMVAVVGLPMVWYAVVA